MDGLETWGFVLRVRRGTSTQWSIANPVLSDGEPGYVTDNNWYKIGDGVTAWNDLPYTTGLPGPEGPEGPEGPKGDPGDFPDTPSDGVLYGRKDQSWVPVPGASVLEAPVDGVGYIRQDGTWESADDRYYTAAQANAEHNTLQTNINTKENAGVAAALDANHVGAANPHPSYLQDAPSDGTQYARVNGTWAQVEGGEGSPILEAPTDGSAYLRQNSSWVNGDTIFETDAAASSAHSSLQTNINTKENAGVAAALDANHVGAANPHPSYLQDAPSDGQVYGRSNGAWALAAGGGGGSVDYLMLGATCMAVIDPNNANTYKTYCRKNGVIYSGSNPAQAIQTAIDRVSNFDGSDTYAGGTVLIGAGQWNLTDPVLGRPVTAQWTITETDVHPVHIRGEGGIRAAPAGNNFSAGTHLVWAGGSAPDTTDAGGVARTGYTVSGAVLNLTNDAHGYRVSDLVIWGGEQVADYAGASAGRGVEWWHCQFREAGVNALLITNGTDTTSDRYVQQRIMFCRWETSAHGPLIQELSTGSGCTDGRIHDCQANNCDGYQLRIEEGGWEINGGHLTGGGDGVNANLIMGAEGFVHGVYFDTNSGGPCVTIANNNVSLTGCRLWTTGREGVNLIEGGGSQGVFITNCLVGGGSNKANYLYNGVGSNVRITGCGGPSTRLTAIVSGTSNAVVSQSVIW